MGEDIRKKRINERRERVKYDRLQRGPPKDKRKHQRREK